MSKQYIFNIGLSKAGTTSLTKAVRQLGYKTVHYWKDPRKQTLKEVINNNKKANKPLIEGIDQYEFYSDFGGRHFFKDLDKDYPNSKFIVTVRGKESWLQSRKKHIERQWNNPNINIKRSIDLKDWSKQYDAFFRDVKAYFKGREHQVLYMNILEGDNWDILCPFLGRPIPDKPFPFLNKAPENSNNQTPIDKRTSNLTGKLPDFLIIGAQKSGTTLLWRILKVHRKISPASQKEIHYFNRKINENYPIEWYKNQFQTTQQKQLHFEATPRYLSTFDVPKKITKILPDIKFIVLLRNPVDRALSQYNIEIRLGYNKHNRSFSEIIKRNINKLTPLTNIESILIQNPNLLHYPVGRGLYAIQLKNWFKYFEREQFLILGFKDLQEHTSSTIRRVCHFLGVDDIEAEKLAGIDIGTRSKHTYSYHITEEEKRTLQTFYEKPNQELFDLLGYQVNW